MLEIRYKYTKYLYATTNALSLQPMQKEIRPYENLDASKKVQVRKMFDTIAGNYDALNRVISLGIDQKWRRKVVAYVAEKQPQKVLDIATGTGDLAVALVASGADQIIGLDLSPGMLALGKKKIAAQHLENTIEMVVGDSEHLEYPDAYFDAVTVAFGVRNFENLQLGLQEIQRVLRPGGQLVILETSVPTKFPFKQGYQLYTHYIMPSIGRLFSKDTAAYGYLSKSAANFPFGRAFNNILKEIGFIDIVDLPQTFGVATIYRATKS
jgi:demethylmenaquinone methyltransferase/2-methoxy-6-polyprenyl-1,4-benzoquinol methylase